MIQSYESPRALICKYCYEKMYRDDVDFNFPGNEDAYYICRECNGTATVKIRYHKIVSIKYYKEV